MKKIDTIIFDIGGVLVDWDPQNLYKKVFDTQEEVDWFLNNVCTPEWNMEQDAGRTIAEANAIKIAEFPKYEEQIKMFYGRWNEMFIGAIEESVEIQQKLIADNNYKICALTNWSAEKWEEGKCLFPCLNDFKNVLVSGQEKIRKPFPEIYELLINRYQLIPENCVFIDDNFDNVEASEKFGISGIHFKSTLQLKEELSKLGIIY